MELLIVAGVVAVVIVALLSVMWKVFSKAFDNGFEWLIHTFGNEQAAKKIEEKWRQQAREERPGDRSRALTTGETGHEHFAHPRPAPPRNRCGG